jgi:DNA-directed RNA polymerase specialized sigma24 family protein
VAGFRETPEVCGAVKRLIRAVGVRIGEGAIPEELQELDRVEEAVREAFRTAVAGLRGLGFSDAEIGRALGISKQAVQQRWPR